MSGFASRPGQSKPRALDEIIASQEMLDEPGHIRWIGGAVRVERYNDVAIRLLDSVLEGIAFAPPRLTSPAAAATTVQGTSLTYDGVARLLGVSLDQTSITPGGVLAVRSCW